MTEISLETLIALGCAGLSLAGFLIERFHYDVAVQKQIGEASERLGKIETKVDLFWGALETQLPGMLLKGNPLNPNSRVAILVEKFHRNRISNGELVELSDLLEVESRNQAHDAGERLVMVLMRAVIKSKTEVKDGLTYCRL